MGSPMLLVPALVAGLFAFSNWPLSHSPRREQAVT